jgi:hypothetical protein
VHAGDRVQLQLAHDQGRTDEQTGVWEAFVGSFTSSEPNLAERTERSCRLSSAGDLGRLRPLVAAGAANDPHHQVCTELLGSATEEMLVPATVSVEVCYMLKTCAGSKSEAAFRWLFPPASWSRSTSLLLTTSSCRHPSSLALEGLRHPDRRTRHFRLLSAGLRFAPRPRHIYRCSFRFARGARSGSRPPRSEVSQTKHRAP